MKIDILALGRSKQDFVLAAEREYLKRLKGLASVALCELEPKAGRNLDPEQRKAKEAAILLERTAKNTFLVVLDETGSQFTSPALSAYIENKLNHGKSHITFALGGAYGWDPQVLDAADLILSLSPLTFSYQLARVVLIEQIYRVVSIMKGSPYHK